MFSVYFFISNFHRFCFKNKQKLLSSSVSHWGKLEENSYIKIPYTFDDIEISFDFERESSDEENFDEKNFDEKNLDKENKNF